MLGFAAYIRSPTPQPNSAEYRPKISEELSSDSYSARDITNIKQHVNSSEQSSFAFYSARHEIRSH